MLLIEKAFFSKTSIQKLNPKRNRGLKSEIVSMKTVSIWNTNISMLVFMALSNLRKYGNGDIVNKSLNYNSY